MYGFMSNISACISFWHRECFISFRKPITLLMVRRRNDWFLYPYAVIAKQEMNMNKLMLSLSVAVAMVIGLAASDNMAQASGKGSKGGSGPSMQHQNPHPGQYSSQNSGHNWFNNSKNTGVWGGFKKFHHNG